MRRSFTSAPFFSTSPQSSGAARRALTAAAADTWGSRVEDGTLRRRGDTGLGGNDDGSPAAAGLVAARSGLVMGLSGAPMRASWDIGRSPRLAGITPSALILRDGTSPMPVRAGTALALLARRCCW